MKQPSGKFIGNPLYRIHEKTIEEKCRDGEKYRKKLFEKNVSSDRRTLR